MGNSFVAGLNIGEAFLKGADQAGYTCPYCNKKEEQDKELAPNNGDQTTQTTQANKITTAPWIDRHITRCRRRKPCLQAAQKLDHERKSNGCTWALHDELGRCMILKIDDGLCLVENTIGRYIVAAADLTIGCVSQCLELIEQRDLSPDQLAELISHLMVKVKSTVRPAMHNGSRVVFKHGDGLSEGRVCRRHGKNCYIVEIEDATGQKTRLNISKTVITQILP